MKPRSKPDEVEQLKQLIAIQSQIVELARRNEATERECEALRRELSEQVRRRRGPSASIADGLRKFSNWLKRWRNSDAQDH